MKRMFETLIVLIVASLALPLMGVAGLISELEEICIAHAD